ncbi:MAG: Minf_1886 family protein [Planctomycetaceae bacterium]
MPLIDPSHPLFQLLQRDRRYSLDGYLFVLEALSFAQDALGMGQAPAAEDLEPLPTDTGASTRSKQGRRRRPVERHVSGQELCEAARRYGLQQYGYLAPTVLAVWGIHRTDDIGEIVFNMIGIGQMRKTRADKREDFHDVYSFGEAFARDLAFVVPDSI